MRPLKDSPEEIMAVLYLQVSIVSQALIFVTRSRSWSFAERPGMFLLGAFLIAQLVRASSARAAAFIIIVMMLTLILADFL